MIENQFIGVDADELSASMGKARLNNKGLAEASKISPNTVTRVLQGHNIDFQTLAKITSGLNKALHSRGHTQINPMDILKIEGFPTPQMGTPH